jgi:hypothetical protein
MIGRNFQDLTIEEFMVEVSTVFDSMETLLKSKRLSYGPGNLSRFGETGIVVRMGDKFQRLENHIDRIMKGESQDVHDDGETIDDAYMDIIGYACLALIYRNLEQRNLSIERWLDQEKDALPSVPTRGQG